MASKRRSPLDPGAYGKPQRWHQLLTARAEAQAAKREDQRRRNEEAANTSVLASIMSIFS